MHLTIALTGLRPSGSPVTLVVGMPPQIQESRQWIVSSIQNRIALDQ